MTTEAIGSCLQQTLDPATRKHAEAQLQGLEVHHPQFGLQLLALVQGGLGDTQTTVPHHIRFSAAVYFKNWTRKHWKQVEGEVDVIPAPDRAAIKENIVSLMIAVPPALQMQLSEAVTIIADNDFPVQWQSLIDDLVAKLTLTDLSVNIGVLQTAHSIFKRWRHQFRSDRLFTEIKFVLTKFAESYLAFYKAIDKLVDENQNNKPVLSQLLEIVLLLNKIFYSLNCQDLPEFFEDNMDAFMDLLLKYLVYQNPLVASEDDAGILEKIKANVCESIDLYARLYEEEFKRLTQFIQTIWTLLTTVGVEPKNDLLVSRALAFLTSVVRPARHRELFGNAETLKSICSSIVLPNMTLRESDEELFEEDPQEYIRRDLEGSDSDTRRRASADLVRGLLEHFAKEVTEIFSQYVTQYLASYEADRVKNWKAKDTALFLITSLSAKTLTAQVGATQTNEYIPILPVFAAHVLPDLQLPIESALHPIIKVDAIKYLTVFRSQLTKTQLLEIMPSLTMHLGSSNYVVHTWTAYSLERILAMRTPDNKTALFSSDDISPYLDAVLDRLFHLIELGKTPEKLAENDYLMKCVMRIVSVAREKMTNVSNVLSHLTGIIKQISINPSNPKFNHYTFETLALMVRFVSSNNPSIILEFDNFLFAPFKEIIDGKVDEFTPYVFQIFSQMLSLHPQDVIPPSYQSILSFLLQPMAWENLGNIPALTSLLQSFVSKGAKQLSQPGQLEPFLGVCQKLVSSRANDSFGLDLLLTIFEAIPTTVLTPYIKNVFVLLLTRLMQAKSSKFNAGFLRFVCYLFAMEKDGFSADVVIQTIDAMQGNSLFGELLRGILIPEMAEVVVVDDRKRCLIGMTKLLTKSNAMVSQYANLWPNVLEAIIAMYEQPIPESNTNAADAFDVPDQVENEDSGYQASFVRLITVSKINKEKDAIHQIPDTKVFFAQCIGQLIQTNPGKFDAVIKTSLARESVSQIKGYLNNSGILL